VGILARVGDDHAAAGVVADTNGSRTGWSTFSLAISRLNLKVASRWNTTSLGLGAVILCFRVRIASAPAATSAK
jgi:hypothetical protein